MMTSVCAQTAELDLRNQARPMNSVNVTKYTTWSSNVTWNTTYAPIKNSLINSACKKSSSTSKQLLMLLCRLTTFLLTNKIVYLCNSRFNLTSKKWSFALKDLKINKMHLRSKGFSINHSPKWLARVMFTSTCPFCQTGSHHA